MLTKSKIVEICPIKNENVAYIFTFPNGSYDVSSIYIKHLKSIDIQTCKIRYDDMDMTDELEYSKLFDTNSKYTTSEIVFKPFYLVNKYKGKDININFEKQTLTTLNMIKDKHKLNFVFTINGDTNKIIENISIVLNITKKLNNASHNIANIRKLKSAIF